MRTYIMIIIVVVVIVITIAIIIIIIISSSIISITYSTHIRDISCVPQPASVEVAEAKMEATTTVPLAERLLAHRVSPLVQPLNCPGSLWETIKVIKLSKFRDPFSNKHRKILFKDPVVVLLFYF